MVNAEASAKFRAWGPDEAIVAALALQTYEQKNEVPYPGTVLEMLCHKRAGTRYVQNAVAQWQSTKIKFILPRTSNRHLMQNGCGQFLLANVLQLPAQDFISP